MKLPKTVQISGKTYTVKKISDKWGGTCRTGRQVITVGTARDQTGERVCANYIHEVLEAVALERKLRYEAADEEMVFVMTHKQFDDYAKDVAMAIRPMIKE